MSYIQYMSLQFFLSLYQSRGVLTNNARKNYAVNSLGFCTRSRVSVTFDRLNVFSNCVAYLYKTTRGFIYFTRVSRVSAVSCTSSTSQIETSLINYRLRLASLLLPSYALLLNPKGNFITIPP